jgi:hypothetical protein
VVTAPPDGGSITDILSGNPDISDFWALVEPVQDTLFPDPAAQYTVFPPSNDALAGLTPPTGQDLIDLLARHVHVGSLDTVQIFQQDSLLMSSGESVPVDAADQTVGGADIVVSDTLAAIDPQGYVQTVDAVLQP